MSCIKLLKKLYLQANSHNEIDHKITSQVYYQTQAWLVD